MGNSGQGITQALLDQNKPLLERIDGLEREVGRIRTESAALREENGRLKLELATCALRGASAYDFLRNALKAQSNNIAPPSLLIL